MRRTNDVSVCHTVGSLLCVRSLEHHVKMDGAYWIHLQGKYSPYASSKNICTSFTYEALWTSTQPSLYVWPWSVMKWHTTVSWRFETLYHCWRWSLNMELWNVLFYKEGPKPVDVSRNFPLVSVLNMGEISEVIEFMAKSFTLQMSIKKFWNTFKLFILLPQLVRKTNPEIIINGLLLYLSKCGNLLASPRSITWLVPS